MKIQADGFEFEFPDALEAFVFDEKDKQHLHFHGLSHAMKAVDLIVEFPDKTLFVEMKDFTDQSTPDLNHLCNWLVGKFRDTWLYRWAEASQGSVTKPVYYLCLLTLEDGLLGKVKKNLSSALPLGFAGPRWTRQIVDKCFVLNIQRWRSSFPNWSVHRIAS